MQAWILAFHLIFVIAWFAGLFYLPRLFVYHAQAHDVISIARFKIMERRLYYGITWPSAILASLCGGILLFSRHAYYWQLNWMHAKLILVFLLWIYHVYLGHLVKIFKRDENKRSDRFYRIINEIPTVLLLGIVVIAVVKY